MDPFAREFWEFTEKKELRMQQCSECKKLRWPAAAVCDKCLSPDYTWELVSGKGQVLSWIVFHRQYFPEYPAPHPAVAVELAEVSIWLNAIYGEQDEQGQPLPARVAASKPMPATFRNGRPPISPTSIRRSRPPSATSSPCSGRTISLPTEPRHQRAAHPSRCLWPTTMRSAPMRRALPRRAARTPFGRRPDHTTASRETTCSSR